MIFRATTTTRMLLGRPSMGSGVPSFQETKHGVLACSTVVYTHMKFRLKLDSYHSTVMPLLLCNGVEVPREFSVG